MNRYPILICSPVVTLALTAAGYPDGRHTQVVATAANAGSKSLLSISAIGNLDAASPPANSHSQRARGTENIQSRLKRTHHGARAVSPLSRIAAMNRAATLNPEGAAFVNAVEVVPFSEGAIFELHTTPERISDIMLQPGEVLGSVASGDTTRWIIGDTSSGSGVDKRVHVLVKPFSAGLSTNLLITTDRRSYHLNLKSNPRVATAGLSWSYPQDALIALKRPLAQRTFATVSGIGTVPDRLNFDYVISGDHPRWRPIRAFDDGDKSYVEFPPGIETDEAPPLFLVSGKDAQLVNYRMQGRFYVVDRLFDAAELRLGTRHAAIVKIRRKTEHADMRNDPR